MSLRKVSDLEGVDIDELSGEGSLFPQHGLFEVSNPVRGEDENVFSYKSQYIRANTLVNYVKSQISGFDHGLSVTSLSVLSGLWLSGDFICNEGNYPNNFRAELNFGQHITLNTQMLSIMDGDTLIATYSADGINFYRDLNMQNRKITLSSAPTNIYDVTNKKYVDETVALCVDTLSDQLPEWGNYVSCNYVILTAQPNTRQLSQPRTFYFVIQPDD